jgi:hypothetical protein
MAATEETAVPADQRKELIHGPELGPFDVIA